MIREYCRLDDTCTRILKNASERYGYSARVIHKLLRLARTAADLEGVQDIRPEDVIKVLKCRDLDTAGTELYTIK